MACNSLLLSVLVLFVALAPLGHAITINPLGLTSVQINGLVACSATGNPPAIGGGIAGVAGVLVSATCNGVSGNLGTALTNATGFYTLAINTLEGILFDVGTCYVTIKLPITGTTCTLFPPTGILKAPLTLLSTVQNLLGGLLGIFTAGTYVYVPL